MTLKHPHDSDIERMEQEDLEDWLEEEESNSWAEAREHASLFADLIHQTLDDPGPPPDDVDGLIAIVENTLAFIKMQVDDG